eukprot:m.110048 g.110048  ORF g.110048 m.110048 type:complete len:263 (-) comp10706_c0_seq4:144-932(-)
MSTEAAGTGGGGEVSTPLSSTAPVAQTQDVAPAAESAAAAAAAAPAVAANNGGNGSSGGGGDGGATNGGAGAGGDAVVPQAPAPPPAPPQQASDCSASPTTATPDAQQPVAVSTPANGAGGSDPSPPGVSGTPAAAPLEGETVKMALRLEDPGNKGKVVDISFDYSVGQDTAEGIARELCDGGFIGILDAGQVAIYLTKILKDPSCDSVTFPLHAVKSELPEGDDGTAHQEKLKAGYAQLIRKPLEEPAVPAADGAAANPTA